MPKLEVGIHLSAYLPEGTDDVPAAEPVHAARVLTTPLSGYYLKEPDKPGLYLGYAGVPEHDIDRAAKKLGTALRDAGY